MDLSKILCDDNEEDDGRGDLPHECQPAQEDAQVPTVLSQSPHQPQDSALAVSESLTSNAEWSTEEIQCAMTIVHCPDQSTKGETTVCNSSCDEPTLESMPVEPDRLELLLQADEMITDCEETMRKEDEKERKLERVRKGDPVYMRKHDQESAPQPHNDSCSWTRQEEEYCALLLFFFLEGKLAIPLDTPLPTYLADELDCSARRIVIKLNSGMLFGQQIPPNMSSAVYAPACCMVDDEQREQMVCMLRASRDRWLNRSKENGQRFNEPPTELATQPRSIPLKDRKTTGNPKIIRTGFESAEEAAYVTALYKFFMEGLLDISEGTRLGPFLCEQLKCDQRTLSMKLAPKRLGESKFPENLGTVIFSPKVLLPTSEDILQVEAMLKDLRDSSLGTNSLNGSRSGPWSREEEVYAAALIEAFLKGVLDIEQGTTLRAFLASRLGCNPMRVSKKLASESIANVRIPKKLGSSTFMSKGVVPIKEKEEAKEILVKLHQAYVNTEGFQRRQRRESQDRVRGLQARKHQRDETLSNIGGSEQESTYDSKPRKKSARVESKLELIQGCPSRSHQPFLFHHKPLPYTLSKC